MMSVGCFVWKYYIYPRSCFVKKEETTDHFSSFPNNIRFFGLSYLSFGQTHSNSDSSSKGHKSNLVGLILMVTVTGYTFKFPLKIFG